MEEIVIGLYGVFCYMSGVYIGYAINRQRNRRALKLVQKTKELWREVLALPSEADLTRAIEEALFEIEKAGVQE